MSLAREDVKKVALLARLQFSDDELDTVTSQLAQILGYIAQLDELETADVAPMAHAADLTNVFADDVVEPSLERPLALSNAPNRDEECYRVPAVLGD